MTMRPTTDKPRKVIVCHPDEVRRIQSSLVEQGVTDVLVQADPFDVVAIDAAYVMDPPPEFPGGDRG